MSKSVQESGEDITLAEFIDMVMTDLDISNRELADELGYANPGIIQMFRKGKIRLPLERLPKLAKAVSANPKWVMEQALLEYFSDDFRALIRTYLCGLSSNEMAIIELIREVSNNSDPAPADDGLWTKIAAAVSAAKDTP